MPVNRKDEVITTGINDVRFWLTNPRDVWPEFFSTKIAHVKRFIRLYEAGEPSSLHAAEGLKMITEGLDIMDWARWYLVRLQRFATPSQLADTVEDIEWMIAQKKKKVEMKTDGLLFMYLGVALIKRGGRDDEAISSFKKAFRVRNDARGPRDTLWARAFYSRVLRRQGMNKEADEQEMWLRRKVRQEMPTGLSGRRELLPFLLDEGEKTNSIVERIGWDYFNACEIRDVANEQLYVPVPGGLLATSVGKDDRIMLSAVEVLKGMKECAITDCHVKENLRKCASCQRVVYCSKEHQVIAWKAEHKYKCKMYQRSLS